MKTHFNYMQIKNFSIFRAKESKSDKSPTHNISAKIGEEYVNIGACWTKEGKAGKYLSCKLQDAYVDHTDRTKSRIGVSITDDRNIISDEPDNTPPEAQNDSLDAF